MSSVVLEGIGVEHENGVRALADISLTVEPGEVVTVVGPSGAGKSTLLRVVCGLTSPTSGRLLISGSDAAKVRPEQRPVAMVFQGYALFPHLTVAGNIGFGLKVRREAGVAERVARTAASLGIDDLLGRRPSQLSGGERQRVALARAIVRDPRVFCLDEPLSNLDPVLRAEARALLAGVLRADGRCALVVTHDQAEALAMGDRVVVLHKGRVQQIGTPLDVYDRPHTGFVASFIGTPPMNVLRTPAPGIPGNGELVGIRPEHVELATGGDMLVTGVEQLGHEVHVAVDFAGQRVVARTADRTHRAGDRVSVRLPTEWLHRLTGS